MNTPFGLVNVWNQGDLVTRAVLLILLTMSLASWMVILLKVLDLRRLRKLSGGTERFWHAKDYAQGMADLGQGEDSPFWALVLRHVNNET